MEVIYLTLEQALTSYARTVEYSGGGTAGELEIGKLESVLTHIQNDEYYPDFIDKLTHLFFCVCKFHCFVDGNKRMAIVLAAQMLLFNGRMAVAQTFLRDTENISYFVAAGNIDKSLLRDYLHALVTGDTDDEGLKLRLFEAMSGVRQLERS